VVSEPVFWEHKLLLCARIASIILNHNMSSSPFTYCGGQFYTLLPAYFELAHFSKQNLTVLFYFSRLP